MGKSSPTMPPAPDPYQTAQAQTQSNLATANANAQLNRVNQNTPWGSLTYTHTPQSQPQPQQTQQSPTVDQQGYDAAMQNYQNALSKGEDYQNIVKPNIADYTHTIPSQTSTVASPNQSPDQWSSNITLSPEQQSLLNSSNAISQGMANLGQKQIGAVSSALASPLNLNGLPAIQNNALVTSAGPGGGFQTNVAPGGIQYHVDNAGQIQKSISPYGAIQDRLDTSNIPGLVSGNALYGAMNQAQQAAYNQQKAFLDPQWAQDQHDLENKLTQQGVMQNSDAWNRAIDDFNRNRSFAYNQAQQSAIGLGNAAQNQLFQQGLSANQNAYNQALGSGQFANQAQAQGFGQNLGMGQFANSAQQQQYNQNANDMQMANAAQQQAFGQALQNAELNNQVRNNLFSQGLMNAQLNNSAANQAFNQSMGARTQGINELMLQRQNPLNELNALRTGSQVTAPTFTNTPQVNMPGVDISNLINQNYANQMGGYNAQVAQNNGLTNGLFGIGAAIAGAPAGGFLSRLIPSDRRLKENVQRVGQTDDGLPIYKFNYIGNATPQMGVMAQDVLEKKPYAVRLHKSGYLMVDYGAL